MMEHKNETIGLLEQSLKESHQKIEDLRTELQVIESEAETTLQLVEVKPRESLGLQLYEFLKEDPLKRIKFIKML